jgi:hypothetical protein
VFTVAGTTKVDAKSTAAKAAPAPKETKKAEAGAPAADVSQLAEPSTEQKKPTTSRKQPALDPAAAAALAEAGPSIAAQLALSKGELPLMLPEKLPRNKVWQHLHQSQMHSDANVEAPAAPSMWAPAD